MSHLHTFTSLKSIGSRSATAVAASVALAYGAAWAQPTPVPSVQQQQQAPQQQEQRQQAPQQQQQQQQQQQRRGFNPYPNFQHRNLPVQQSNNTQRGGSGGVSLEALQESVQLRELKSYDKPQIQIAILLDVSGSMSGLINQARAELWKVVNTFEGVKREGVTPEVRVALYSYGASATGPFGVYVHPLVELTTDLDDVSDALFKLETSGSSELCSSAIVAAARGQAWSASSSDLKAIIIAGNETFLQGAVTPEEAFKVTGARGVVTHTVHCGKPDEGIRDHWREAARLGEGQFMNIDHNSKEEYIETPFDDELEKLNGALNDTYLPYGAYGARGKQNQMRQDSNAAKLNRASALSRSMTKSGSYYNNARWDLVDAFERETLNLDELDVSALPEAMRSMSKEERVAYVRSFLEKRRAIQEQIRSLGERRRAFIAEARKARSADRGEALDSAMIKALRDQAKALGFTW